MRLAAIAIVARNRAIGRGNGLLVHLPDDLRHFKRTTLGCPVIMGRKTYDSVGRPLPGRRNLVVTRNAAWHAEGVETAPSLDAALQQVADAPKAFIIGGGELYAQALPLLDELVLTEIDRDIDGDTFFPDWRGAGFVETSREPHRAPAPLDFDYAFVTYERQR